MSKAQARKRLDEAASKIAAVQLAGITGKINGMPMPIINKLFPMMIELRKMADKLK